MSMLFGGPKITPPPPPPPPANPPTFASQISTPPTAGSAAAFAGLGQSILTSPQGALDQRATQRKSLLGQ